MRKTSLTLGTLAVAIFSTFGCESGSHDGASDVESIVGADERVLLSAQDNTMNHRAVGILGPLKCTGWFISKNFFVTNQHCVASGEDALPENGLQQYSPADYCSGMTIDVNNYRGATFSERSAGTYRCKKIHLANQAHDLAIVEIEGSANVEPFKMSNAVAGMNIVVIGHPNAEVKTLSEKNGQVPCVLRDVTFPAGKTARDAHIPRQRPKYEHSIEHDCDTLGGSSGSPIIDKATGAVVALHWDGWQSSAWPHADPNGPRSVTVNIEDPANPGTLVPFTFRHREGNVGIRIQDIKALVQQAAANDASLAAVAALFAP